MLFARKGDFEIPRTGISTIETIELGGIAQTILIQGEDARNPVLLMLHGGPSMPLPGVSSRSRDFAVATATKELVKHFTVVFWDQRGTGKSYHKSIPQESMHIGQYVEDANELTDYLRERFRQEKIFLAGHSWGSILGLRLASEQPHKFHFYTGLSQVISWAENDRLSYAWTCKEAEKRGSRKAIQELERVGQPPYTKSLEQWGVLRSWQMRFGSMIYEDAEVKHPGMKGALMLLLQSPDYTMRDVINALYRGFQFSYSQRMIEEFAEIDFKRTAARLEIPSCFIHGRHDVHVWGQLLTDYLADVETDYAKQLYWLEKSSHLFHPDDAKRVEQIFIDEVRPAADIHI